MRKPNKSTTNLSAHRLEVCYYMAIDPDSMSTTGKFRLRTSSLTHADNLAWLAQTSVLSSLSHIKHGIERECLRVTPDGKLSTLPHDPRLGSALTHDHITTDYAETLLEFITPPSERIHDTLQQLRDIHTFCLEQLADERLWPLSMPCFVGDANDIALANYGQSNIGKMKHIYRKGLKNRYGSMMQVIAGVHFNFSLPQDFWQLWCEHQGITCDQDAISAGYLHMIRNYRRMCWLIPYLFGASPAICSSFLQNKPTTLPFQKLGKGTIYLPYATSLRMSDLGYTNSAQSDLAISYNSLPSYIQSVRRAINTPSEHYAHIPAGANGVYEQLNSNVLQIENELYSPIRPKQVAQSGEKPSTALAKRGIQYIEVRALDLDPYSPVGVNQQQIQWLDVFLLHCLMSPSPALDEAEYRQTDANLNAVVLAGRDPELQLQQGTESRAMREWAEDIFNDMARIADLLDSHSIDSGFANAVSSERCKVNQPELTPSGQLLQTMLAQDIDNGKLGMQLAEEHKQALLSRDYEVFGKDYFTQLAANSHTKQAQIEARDTKDFATFLADYFTYHEGDDVN